MACRVYNLTDWSRDKVGLVHAGALAASTTHCSAPLQLEALKTWPVRSKFQLHQDSRGNDWCHGARPGNMLWNMTSVVAQTLIDVDVAARGGEGHGGHSRVVGIMGNNRHSSFCSAQSVLTRTYQSYHIHIMKHSAILYSILILHVD